MTSEETETNYYGCQLALGNCKINIISLHNLIIKALVYMRKTVKILDKHIVTKIITQTTITGTFSPTGLIK